MAARPSDLPQIPAMISGRCRLRHRASQITEPTALPQLTTRRSLASRGLSHIRSGLGFCLQLSSRWPVPVAGLAALGLTNPAIPVSWRPCSLACSHGGPRPVTVQHAGDSSDSRG